MDQAKERQLSPAYAIEDLVGDVNSLYLMEKGAQVKRKTISGVRSRSSAYPDMANGGGDCPVPLRSLTKAMPAVSEDDH